MSLEDFETPLPEYISKIKNLGEKYGVPVEIDSSRKTVRVFIKTALDSEVIRDFGEVVKGGGPNHPEWDIIYT